MPTNIKRNEDLLVIRSSLPELANGPKMRSGRGEQGLAQEAARTHRGNVQGNYAVCYCLGTDVCDCVRAGSEKFRTMFSLWLFGMCLKLKRKTKR